MPDDQIQKNKDATSALDFQNHKKSTCEFIMFNIVVWPVIDHPSSIKY